MDLNATLFGQMITFAIFVWFTMKFVWPPLVKAMKERQDKIAAGLADAEKAASDLENTSVQIDIMVEEAKSKAADIIEAAKRRGDHIVEEAKSKAITEGERIKANVQDDIQREYQQAKAALLGEVSDLALVGAEKILKRSVDTSIVKELAGEL